MGLRKQNTPPTTPNNTNAFYRPRDSIFFGYADLRRGVQLPGTRHVLVKVRSQPEPEATGHDVSR